MACGMVGDGREGGEGWCASDMDFDSKRQFDGYFASTASGESVDCFAIWPRHWKYATTSVVGVDATTIVAGVDVAAGVSMVLLRRPVSQWLTYTLSRRLRWLLPPRIGGCRGLPCLRTVMAMVRG